MEGENVEPVKIDKTFSIQLSKGITTFEPGAQLEYSTKLIRVRQRLITLRQPN